MTFKQWAQVIGWSIVTLAVVFAVMLGVQAVIVDTGRAILH